MSNINFNFVEIMNLKNYECVYMDEKYANYEKQIKHIHKNRKMFLRLLEKTTDTNHFIQRVYNCPNQKSQFYIDKNENVVLNDKFDSKNEEVIFDYNMVIGYEDIKKIPVIKNRFKDYIINLHDIMEYESIINKQKKQKKQPIIIREPITIRDSITINNELFFYKFRPIKLIKNYISLYRDLSCLALINNEIGYNMELLKDKVENNDEFGNFDYSFYNTIMESSNMIYIIKNILPFIGKNKHFTTIYEIEVFKLSKTNYEFKDTLQRELQVKLNPLNDDDLISLFENKIVLSKNQKKKLKLKNKQETIQPELIIEPEIIIENEPELIIETEPELIIEPEPEIIEPENEPSIEPESVNKINRPLISFNSYLYNNLKMIDKLEIYRLLNELFEYNTKYKSFLQSNNYRYIKVIKSFHYDLNYNDNSYHINLVFASSKDNFFNSDVYHIYVDINTNEIVSITSLNSLLK